MVQMQIYGILRKEMKEKKYNCRLVLIKGSQILMGGEEKKSLMGVVLFPKDGIFISFHFFMLNGMADWAGV